MFLFMLHISNSSSKLFQFREVLEWSSPSVILTPRDAFWVSIYMYIYI